MSDSKLQRWALTAEIIGGAAIVISLLFVGYEVRQSSKAQRAATYQSLVQNYEALHDPLIVDSEFAIIWESGRVPESLSIPEKRRLFAFAGRNFRHGELAFKHYKQGTLNKEELNRFLEIVVGRKSSHAVFSEYWDLLKGRAFPPDYVAYLDALLAERDSE